MSFIKSYLSNIIQAFKLLFGRKYIIHTIILLISVIFLGFATSYLAEPIGGLLPPEFIILSLLGGSIGHTYIIYAILASFEKGKKFLTRAKSRWILIPISFLILVIVIFSIFLNIARNPIFAIPIFIYFEYVIFPYISYLWLIIQVISLAFLFKGLTPKNEINSYSKSYKILSILAPILGIILITFSWLFVNFINILSEFIDPTNPVLVSNIIVSFLYFYTFSNLLISIFGLKRSSFKIQKYIPIFYLLSIVYMYYQLISIYVNAIGASGSVIAAIDFVLLIALTFYSLQSIGFKLRDQRMGLFNNINSMFILFFIVVIYLTVIYQTVWFSLSGFIIGTTVAHLILFVISPIIFLPLSIILIDYHSPEKILSDDDIWEKKHEFNK